MAGSRQIPSRVVLTDQQGRVELGYNAIEAKGRRQAPATLLKHEDRVLLPKDRDKLTATTRDAQRNLALLSWAVRRHLDYVSRFDVHVTGLPDDLTVEMQALFEWHARKQNFDPGKRHSRNSAMRIFEAGKVLDGDAAWVKLSTGKIQSLEGTRIAKPRDTTDMSLAVKTKLQQVSEHGLILDEFGGIAQACVCKRKSTAGIANNGPLIFDKFVDGGNLILGGYFTRAEQTRGVSPLTTALNTFRDLYEGWEWTLIKIKLHALFGVAIFRDAVGGDGFPTTATEDADVDIDSEEVTDNRYDVSLKDGIMMLDLDPGDRAEMLESKTPNSQVGPYSELMIRISLLALDIPFTFFNSAKASFSARIADRVEYEESARFKREDNQASLADYSDACLVRWVNRADMLQPYMQRHGLTLRQVQRAVEWVPAGQPWLDKLNEVSGDARAIGAGLDSRQRICKRRGQGDWKTIAMELKEETEFYRANDIPITIGDSGQDTVQQKDVATESETESETEGDADGNE